VWVLENDYPYQDLEVYLKSRETGMKLKNGTNSKIKAVVNNMFLALVIIFIILIKYNSMQRRPTFWTLPLDML